MKLKKWTNLVLISSLIFLVAACHKKPQQGAGYGGYYSHRQAQALGLGEESSFGRQSERNEQMLSKRVYYFAFDSNVVQENDRPAINANADYLRSHPNARVLLEGHTDPRGSREYNIALGERRAKAVADIMVGRGVHPSQIRIVSYGAEKLAAPGHNESAYQLDRRVVLLFLRK